MWQDFAACAGMDTGLFYPSEMAGRKGRDMITERERVELAKKTCESCEVRIDCLDYALRTKETNGIWGGLTPKEREAVR